MNKRGMIYTVVVLIFFAVMLNVFYTHEVYSFGEKQDAIEIRISTMNDFIKDLDKDAERAAYIAGFRSLIALEEYISSKGEFVSDIDASFREAFYNGSIGNYSPTILDQSSFSVYLARVNEKSEEIDIQLSVVVKDVNLYQETPWIVKVEVITAINITDRKGLANWVYNDTFTSLIPIIGFRNPLFSVNTLGRLHSFVAAVPSNMTEFVINNQTDNLLELIAEGYYVESTQAPSFIMRFEGNLSNDTNGIEALVDIEFLEKQEDITIDYDRSLVDYIYFGNQSTTNVCTVQNMPAWFKIDDNHLNDYEINELTYVACP
jgi:hypothetical protein